MKWMEGGVCAAKGFCAGGLHVGVKSHNPDKKDLALIVSEKECTAAAVFTKNAVKAAPILVDMEHLQGKGIRGIVANSGNANACAPGGMENARKMCAAAAKEIGCQEDQLLVSSTGVIGQTLNIAVIEEGMPQLYRMLSPDCVGSDGAAHAIMTTDTTKKEVALELEIGGKTVHMGGIAKGSGMIHPNMGTMLCFITTDCCIAADMLRSALLETVGVTFNRISVDGDTSTNDSCIVLANGMAGNAEITEKGEAYKAFTEALKALSTKLAKAMASDGEGAKHLITCTVSGAKSVEGAETMAKSVISSTLTKAAIFGADANWGRVLCAMGYSGVSFDPLQVCVHFASKAGKILVCQNGQGVSFDEDMAKKILTEHDVEILITLAEGQEMCTCWGCDITYDYIKINGDYRT